MKKMICVATALTTLLVASAAMAQDLTVLRSSSSPSDMPAQPLESAPALSASTPEMWFYLMETRRAESPSVLRLQRAQFIAGQRNARIAAREWYGVSVARPEANATPFFREYSNLRTNISYSPETQLRYTTGVRPVYVTEGRQF
ncbi:hypothetical protein LOC68_27515 [Blastopirellula sp. JC732]|uniref:Uncharacterized protein n=1 Tax=Blastopirellula sediminis TaxID=2894196 RepID=A0A9X1MSW3_9BACT|nr:hypothetical protein [Blastopirellula sediminis]MCC9604540.1 hypothetical protein [Blastopirellula sediminis]MCC9632161.1 hypothetical protein [Blastopirellula sediminis]